MNIPLKNFSIHLNVTHNSPFKVLVIGIRLKVEIVEYFSCRRQKIGRQVEIIDLKSEVSLLSNYEHSSVVRRRS